MHNGSALAFQARGAGPIPAIRFRSFASYWASVAKGLRQWIVTPPFAGSSPVIRLFIIISCLNGNKIKNHKTYL